MAPPSLSPLLLWLLLLLVLISSPVSKVIAEELVEVEEASSAAAATTTTEDGGSNSNSTSLAPQEDDDEEQQQQEEEDEIHPWHFCNPSAPEQPCALGKFCTMNNNEELAGSVCDVCPAEDTSCEDSLLDDDQNQNAAVEECNKSCNFGFQGDACDAEHLCSPGHYYCDYRNQDHGVCQSCSSSNAIQSKEDCITKVDGTLGQEDCLLSCDLKCYPISWPSVVVEGQNYTCNTLLGSPALSAVGPLVDCTNLVYPHETTCPGARGGGICLVQDETNGDIFNYQIVRKCQDSGGVAAIHFADYFSPTEPYIGTLGFQETTIPSITISFNDGLFLRENAIGAMTNVTVEVEGDYCWRDQSCSPDIPCIGANEGRYCGHDFYEEGLCWQCPVDENDNPDPYGCFFDKSGLANEKIQAEVESCAEVCAANLKFATCKFCPQDFNAFEFGIESEEDKCDFCPENDIEYPDRRVPLFGGNITCWQMQNFFHRIDINKHSKNCKLAQMMNYVCGCDGPGYGGASTLTRRKVLVWLPRTAAFISLLGSSFIVFDASKTKERRQEVFYQLMVILSIFDVLGSLGYLFTSLPIPEDDYMYQSYGNDASCVAQGFFIQLGTISCYTNVSLAVYYLLVIKFGCTEEIIRKYRILLFGFPVAVGLAFAIGGINYYGNMILWCNNAASWWPDISVAVAILIATIVMMAILISVYTREKASERWRSPVETRETLSGKVFWQAFWYIIAFYITWVPYLALQYSWATGESFSKYGFILFAGTMVPLQGAWNFFVYIRPRYLKGISERVSLLRGSSTHSGSKILKRSSKLKTSSEITHLPAVFGTKASPCNQTISTQDPSSLRLGLPVPAEASDPTIEEEDKDVAKQIPEESKDEKNTA